MNKHKKSLEKIFNAYAKGSKRGVKIIILSTFKIMLRDLEIIPHIISEYKCTQLYKYLDSSRTSIKDYPEEIVTFQVFLLSVYIIFSLILEEATEISAKVKFVLKWLKEHAKDKLAGEHANKEDRRLKFTNNRLSRM
jgi:hypothetical protein